ncbi:MAG: ABC transporter permease [Dehalococcoidia bacterium]|nr:MAG: ABC transporter permease [Dehalococcoidia bacterium]
MKFSRAFAITKRIFKGLRHDRRTVALIVIAPLLAMSIFGIAFSGSVTDVGVVVVNLDEGPLAARIVSNLDEDTLDIRYTDSEKDAVEEVENGETWAAIVFPQDFTTNVMAKLEGNPAAGDAPISVRADDSNVNVATAIKKAVRDAVTTTMSQLGREMPITIDDSPVYGKGAEFIDFFVPGIMAFAVFILTTLLTLLSFVGERTSGTLERLRASPIRESEIVVGYAMAFGIIGMLQASLLLIVATLVFKITIVGNPFLAYIIVALLAAVSVNLGILLSSAAKREAQAIQFFPFITLPTFLLAGIFWPVEAIPSVLRPLSYLIPPTYAVEAMRSVILRGWGLGDIWLEIVALLAFGLVFLALSVRSLQREMG